MGFLRSEAERRSESGRPSCWQVLLNWDTFSKARNSELVLTTLRSAPRRGPGRVASMWEAMSASGCPWLRAMAWISSLEGGESMASSRAAPISVLISSARSVSSSQIRFSSELGSSSSGGSRKSAGRSLKTDISPQPFNSILFPFFKSKKKMKKGGF